MSKIVQAINSMIANPQNLSKVIEGESEIFFLYKGKYKWSITKRSDGFHVWFYPGDISLEALASIEEMGESYEGIPMVHYHDNDIGTKEARATFSELYTLVSEKVYGIDTVLDDIISDADL